MFPAELSRIERTLLVIALVFIIIIAVKMTMFFVTIILTSIFFAMLAYPSLTWLKKKGLSDIVAVSIITVIACLVIVAFILLTVLSVNTLINDIPLFQQELNMRLADITHLLQTVGIPNNALSLPQVNLDSIISLVISSVMGLGEAVIFLFFVGVTTFFLLLETPHLGTRFRQLGGKSPETIRQVSRMAGYVTDFIVVRTETNLIHGVLFGGFLSIMGVHAAILWGILVFLLGYIPYIGLIIASVPAIFFAWLQFGVWGAVAVIAAVCVLNLIVENPVYSYLAAQKFEVPALIVIISVIFWGWLLGLIGMFFAIPLTLLLFLVFQIFEECRWINRVMGVSHLFEEDQADSPTFVPESQ
ncbi:AI-2E family transporter [uncultured Methanoregula sp.]|uniref:AI-2E family transporter n=1 Tax=uncultured Methanoregula sp. TaxID=1005933 RepID=UPI00374977DE